MPAWCEAGKRWRFQLGYLLRFVLSGQPDFTRPVRRRHWKETESSYRPAESHWYQRLYGLYNGQPAFGDDWNPITDWMEGFLLALLRWPGCRAPDGFGWVEQGIEEARTQIGQRIVDLEQRRGSATGALILPLLAKRPTATDRKRPLRACVVQTAIPAADDFQYTDLALNEPAIRRRHRNHLSAALAAVERMLALRKTHTGSEGRLDWLILPELAVHPNDVRTHLVPFARAHGAMILAGLTYQEILEGKPLVNSALWVIPEWSDACGLQIKTRRQGKAHLAPNESAFNGGGAHVLQGFRPCQWLIGYPWSSADGTRPVWLTAAVCYDATDLGLAAGSQGCVRCPGDPGAQQGRQDVRPNGPGAALPHVPARDSRQQRAVWREQRLLAPERCSHQAGLPHPRAAAGFDRIPRNRRHRRVPRSPRRVGSQRRRLEASPRRCEHDIVRRFVVTSFAADARRLPHHHITIRVPWHDGGWTGSVCARPLDNSSCLILPRIGEGRRDEVEARCASRRLDELDRANLPPCVGERVSFMAPFALTRTMTHPYTEFYPDTHAHFAPTRFVQPAYSAACVPFRWMLREKVEGSAKDGEIGIAERLKIGWVPDREPDIRNHRGNQIETAWVQERGNQLALLDTFFGALRPEESLCFFYGQAHPALRAVPARNCRGRPCALTGRGHRVQLQGEQPAPALRALGAQRGATRSGPASRTASSFPIRRRWRSPSVRGSTPRSSWLSPRTSTSTPTPTVRNS